MASMNEYTAPSLSNAHARDSVFVQENECPFQSQSNVHCLHGFLLNLRSVRLNSMLTLIPAFTHGSSFHLFLYISHTFQYPIGLYSTRVLISVYFIFLLSLFSHVHTTLPYFNCSNVYYWTVYYQMIPLIQ